MKSSEEVLEITKRWLETFVIGLNLCPFARHPYRADKIRYVVVRGENKEQIVECLLVEIKEMLEVSPADIETTLLILPDALSEFDNYLTFLDMLEEIVVEIEVDGTIQVASFHPQYQFQDTEPDDVENYTNRSPFPMFHLLREASIERAIEAFPEVGDIPEKNIETMNNLGIYRVKQMLYDLD